MFYLGEGSLGEDTERIDMVSKGMKKASYTRRAVGSIEILLTLLILRKRVTHINRQVFPQAPSPTMTSLRRISAILR